MNKLYKFIFLCLIISGCSKEPELTADMLGGGIIFDPTLYEPEKFLVSKALPNPTPQQAALPVIIASHGYSASTFEWNEFKTYLGGREDVLLSQVLLGGHGGNYEDFKNSGWQDWQQAITDEYTSLVNAGYTNIHFLGSSTSGALFLELLSGPYFDDKPVPGQILLIDPIIIPSNKTLSLIHLVGPMLGYLEVDQSAEEDKVYFHYRPQETLRELQNLLNIVREELEDGIRLTQGTSLKIYKSKSDLTADPASAVLIYKGVSTYAGGNVDVEIVNSNMHVFTRLDLRPFTQQDKINQEKTFQDILTRVLGEF